MLVSSRAVLFGFSGFVLDQIRAHRERFLGLDLDSDGFMVFALSALHNLCTLYSAFLAWGGHSDSCSSGLLQHAQKCVNSAGSVLR